MISFPLKKMVFYIVFKPLSSSSVEIQADLSNNRPSRLSRFHEIES